MGVVIGIVAHQSRRAQTAMLETNVNALTSSVDDGSLGCEENHLKVLRELNRESMHMPDSWVVVLEDDAVPVAGFNHHLARALKHAPSPVVGLYLGTGNPSGEAQRQIRQAVVSAQERRCAWIAADCLIGSVGYAIRDHAIDDLLTFIDEQERQNEELPLRISRWAQRRCIDISYTQPSLVNHADGDPVNPVPPGRRDRRAWSYGVRDNWDTGTVRLGHIPKWSGGGPDGSFDIGARLSQHNDWK